MPTRRMSARDARANFGDLLNSVHYTREPVIIEKKGRPFAVVVTLEEHEAIQKIREEFFAIMDGIRERNAEKEPAEVELDVTAMVEAVRQEMYDERKKAPKGRH